MTDRRWDAQEGVVATQLAVLMPALLLLVMLAVQFALWMHATQLADAAATTAASTAALPDSTLDAAEAAGAGLLRQAGNLTDITITVQRSDATAVATVTGAAPNVVPAWRWKVTGQAAVPVERFIGQADR